MPQAGKPSSTNNITRYWGTAAAACSYKSEASGFSPNNCPHQYSIVVAPTMNSMTHCLMQSSVSTSKSSSSGNGYARCCMLLQPADAKFCLACIWHPRTGPPDPRTSKHRPQSQQHMPCRPRNELCPSEYTRTIYPRFRSPGPQ
jgi:hypothetical protein